MLRCRYGQPGDQLWVREKWAISALHDGPRVVYAADGDWSGRAIAHRWNSPIHMPRRWSRITLEITGIRAERLREISEEDARAEGLESLAGDGTGPGPGYKWHGLGYWDGSSRDAWGKTWHAPASDGFCCCYVGRADRLTPVRCAYRHLWDRINGKSHPWASNPWIWCIEFGMAKP